MPDHFLDLADAPRIIDFLVMASGFAGKKERHEASLLVKAYHDGTPAPVEELAVAARSLALSTWPARHAVRHYLTHEGAEEEWKRVTAMVRPSTKTLMNRFRKGVNAKTLDEVLKHDDVGSALREDDEVYEIAHVRDQVAEDVWKEKQEALGVRVKDGVREVEAYRERFRRLRDLAEALPAAAQEEVLAKMRQYEDRILFQGEVVPLEILDNEIAFYTEEKEIAPVDD